MGLWSWAKTAAQNALQGQINWQEGQAPSTINDSARATMADIAKWRDDISGGLTTTGAAGVYSVQTNSQIGNLVAGISIMIKANHASPGASTLNVDGKGAKKLRVIDDGGERDLKAAEFDAGGFYPVVYDPAADGGVGAWIVSGIVTPELDTSNFALKVEAEQEIASADTCDIGAQSAYRLNVTGTTTITSFGTVANSRKLLRFSDALTLTHHATKLILPGGVDAVTKAGDVAEFVSDSSGNWRCAGMLRADGRALISDTLLDEDDFASDSDTQAATQQSIKAYVDSQSVFGSLYESSELSITASSEAAVSHGLGAKPKMIWAVLVCKTAELGFSVGDEYQYPLGHASYAEGNGIAAKADDTQIKIRFLSGSTPAIGRFDVYSNTFLTAANWKLKIKAAL
ncbi:MAG: hypothetical protein N4A65_00290 [Cohaesibacter sp.]|jgi:hypothetical protein|nr:hypothetical protein [Cohaesibacter sp.]